MNNDIHIAYQFKEGKFLYRTPEQVEKAIDNKESWYHKGEYVLVNSRGYIFDSSSIKVFKKANKALKFSNDTVYITVEGKKLIKGVSVRSYSGELSARYREGQFLRVIRKGYYKRYLWGWGVDNKEEIMEAVEHYQDYPEVIYMGVDDNQLKYTPLEELAKWLLDNKRGVFQDADIPKSSKQAIMRDLGYSSEELGEGAERLPRVDGGYRWEPKQKDYKVLTKHKGRRFKVGESKGWVTEKDWEK